MRLAAGTMCALLVMGSPAARGDDPPPPVHAAFRWPAGLSASLEIRSISDATGQPHVDLATRCRLGSKPHARGLLISCREATIAPEFPGAFAALSEYLRLQAEFEWLVSPDGAFLELLGTDRAMAAFWKLPGPAQAPAAERQRLGDQALATSVAEARESWWTLVEAWTGGPLAVGKVLASRGTVELPLAPGVPVATSQTATAGRWLPCPGRPEVRCLELHLATRVDPADFQAAMEASAKQASRPLDAAFREATWSRDAVLVTDPATLVPYRLSVKTVLAARAGEGTLRRATEKTWTFSYGQRAGREAVPGP